MASLTLFGGENQFSWQITGLSSAFGQNNGYVQAGITRFQFTSSSQTISGVVDSVTAPGTGTSTSTPLSSVSYDPGNYQFWGFTRVADGTYYPAGSASVTVDGGAAERPSNWSWQSNVASGATISLSAAEFNAFLGRINDFRVYLGLPQYGAFQYAQSGGLITAAIVAQTIYAINAMNPPVSAPSVPAQGDTITASFFNGLAAALNSIP